MLSDAQIVTLDTAITAETDAAFVALRNAGATGAMAEWYNQPHASFVVWRTEVGEHEITRNVSGEGTSWSWPAYIARSQGERDGWARMFNSSFSVNPSLANVRTAFQDIFSGGALAPAQRTHLQAICKRLATRGERLFTTGTGTLVAPGFLTFEGAITDSDVVRAIA